MWELGLRVLALIERAVVAWERFVDAAERQVDLAALRSEAELGELFDDDESDRTA